VHFSQRTLYRMLPRRFKEEALVRKMAAELPAITGAPASIVLNQASEHGRHRFQIDFHRIGNQLHVGLDRDLMARDALHFEIMWRRLPSFVRIMSRTAEGVVSAVANASDGGDNIPNELAYASNVEQSILVPDPGFMMPDYYAPFRTLAENRPGQWSSRQDTLLWRGDVSGHGDTTTDQMDIDDPNLKQRVRMCLALRGLDDVDVKLFVSDRENQHQATREAMEAHGILGKPVPPVRWIDVKFALDIDGSSVSWGNLYTRLLLGCCVLKVASPTGMRQWFYDEFVPWTHYVPVAADLSDVIDKVEWCRAHDQACREIAAAGQEFALRRTRESETVAVVQRINEMLGPG
jgi:hypothetical protein